MKLIDKAKHIVTQAREIRPILWRTQGHWTTIAGVSTPWFVLSVHLMPPVLKPIPTRPFMHWAAPSTDAREKAQRIGWST